MITYRQSHSHSVLLNPVYQIGVCLTVMFEIAHSGPVPCCSVKSCYLNSSTVNCKMHFAIRSSFFYYLRNYFHCFTKLISKPYCLAVVQQNYSLYSWREVSTTTALKILER